MMRQFTFYLDDITKNNVRIRLEQINMDDVTDAPCVPLHKGALSALIRSLLREFVQNPSIVSKDKIIAEYLYTTHKNKRSKL